MADRFPSLEEFDSGVKTEALDVDLPVDARASTSADDFLAREKALLGDDADQFAGPEDRVVATEDDDDTPPAVHDEYEQSKSTFEAQFPDLSAEPYNSGFHDPALDDEEPEVVREWRAERDAAMAKRAEQFARQREETIAEARQNIDDFYENYNAKKEKQAAATRQEAEAFLAAREDTVSGGTSWERIAKLVDVSGKGTIGGAAGSGKERFRELLTSLRKDDKAPGASGY